MNKLNIAPGLQLPAVIGTETVAILGRRGSGKSNTATVIAEELIRAGQQVVLIDPKGEAWGLKAQGDGGPGLDVIVFGDPEPDLPLREEHGPTIADFVVGQGRSCVLSVKGLVSDASQRRFVARFAERLFELKGKSRTPLTVVIDEAHLFVPQRTDPGVIDVLTRLQRLVRLGRSSGIGVVLVDQRPASVNKDVLTQLEVLICHQLTGPQDRKAVDDWIEANADRDKAAEFRRSLPTLAKGEAWVWSPALLKVFKRVAVRHRDTFDSSKTPVLGELGVKPPKMRPVNLDDLRGQLEAVVAEAKANDPVELKRKLAAAKAELAKAAAAKPTVVAPEVKRVEVPVLKDGQLARVEALIGRLTDLIVRGGELVAEIKGATEPVTSAVRATRTPGPAIAPAPRPPAHAPHQAALANGLATPARDVSGRDQLAGPERRVLDSLAFWEKVGVSTPGDTAVATKAGYSPTSSAYERPRGSLRTAGLIQFPDPSSDARTLTARGRELAEYPAEAGTLADLHKAVRGVLDGPQTKLFDVLLKRYPAVISNEELATAAGYSVTSSAYERPRGKLRTLGLAEFRDGGVAATALLFPSALA